MTGRTLTACLAVSACAAIIGVEVGSHVASLAVLGAGVVGWAAHCAVVEDVRRG